MNKSAIKNFAIRARNKLIEDITQKVYELGISEKEIKEIETFEGGFRIQGFNNGKTYKIYEIKQREKLVTNIIDNGYEQVIEEVAYTWFNRFIALRFMEVNDYLPTGVRVLSSVEEGKKEPDIIKEALNVDLDIDKEIIYKLIDANDTDDLYKYLLIKQCNELGKIMSMVFEEISDYTELLLPDNLLAENSVIRDLVDSIEEEDYKDQVEIIGWMYQYYISEKKDEVFADLKKNKKITKENIPAATQLFTPKWIVKYMVENSLGRLWLESHPDEELQAQWKYYLEEAEQDTEVQKKLDELKNPNLNPEEIKMLDPACGSGHILVYAFDVLYDIYLKANYSERDIPQLILEKNLYGLDIDDRAGQLASFALIMKARNKNRKIFKKKINLNVCSVQESSSIPKEAIDYFAGENLEFKKDVEYLIGVFYDAKEYGSILDVKKVDYAAVEYRIEEIRNEDTKVYDLKYKEIILEKLSLLVKQVRIMNCKYDVVCTNPPYMGNKGMNTKVSNYVMKNYPESKSDLFAVFIEKCNQITKKNCYQAMITQQSWMFLSSYEKLRVKLLRNDIINMAHLGARAFEEIGGEVVQTTAFVLKNSNVENYKANFVRLVDYNSQTAKEEAFLGCNNIYIAQKENFEKIPSTPVAYWVSKKLLASFNNKLLGCYAEPKQGFATGDNSQFLRFWHEVGIFNLAFGCKNIQESEESGCRWFPCNKGGTFRKWYGNNNIVANWENNGEKMKQHSGAVIRNPQYYFKEGITWSTIANDLSMRYSGYGYVFETKGSVCFVKDRNHLYYMLGLLNCKAVEKFLLVLSPTLDFHEGPMARIPIVIMPDSIDIVDGLVKNNIRISQTDWNSFETSWEFKTHPLITYRSGAGYADVPMEQWKYRIADAYRSWESNAKAKFNVLKANEEKLNRIFIDIYGLKDELNPVVEDKDITIRKADRERDIKSFISYAVGCMFGRYSLDEEGLIYAGGEFNNNRYSKYIPSYDNVLVIADDEYFEDDMVNRFVEFLKVTFGEETLEEDLDYIAETLGQKSNETSRQTIRRYLLKDFYNDHVKTYKKRPIYWLFDSGKQNGFNALIYMHRYDSSTVARVRIDYLHKLQRKYEAEVKRLDILIESDLSPRDMAAAKKKKNSISKQIFECITYDQVIAHVANQKIEIDLDDGVAVNYEKFQNVEVPQGEGKKLLKANLLAKIN